jgi:hypothetical protein
MAIDVDFCDPLNKFHNHDKEEDCAGGVKGKESGVRMSPDNVSNGKYWGLGSPENVGW